MKDQTDPSSTIAIFEAFVPSSNEAPDHAVGLYTGELCNIRQWVALVSGDRYFPNQVRIHRRDVYHVDAGKVATWQAEQLAKRRAAEAAVGEILVKHTRRASLPRTD